MVSSEVKQCQHQQQLIPITKQAKSGGSGAGGPSKEITGMPLSVAERRLCLLLYQTKPNTYHQEGSTSVAGERHCWLAEKSSIYKIKALINENSNSGVEHGGGQAKTRCHTKSAQKNKLFSIINNQSNKNRAEGTKS